MSPWLAKDNFSRFRKGSEETSKSLFNKSRHRSMWLRYCQYSVKHQEQSIRLRNMVSIFWICPFRNFLENSIVKTMIFGTKGSSAKWNFYDSILHLKTDSLRSLLFQLFQKWKTLYQNCNFKAFGIRLFWHYANGFVLCLNFTKIWSIRWLQW